MPCAAIFISSMPSTYHIQADDLAAGLLDLAGLAEEVPEPRLRNDIVWCEDAHAVQLWVGV